MEAITPDLVARIASRLYNATPQAGATPPDPGAARAGGPGVPAGLAGLFRGGAPLPGGGTPSLGALGGPQLPAPPAGPALPHPAGAPGTAQAPSLVHALGSPGAPRAPGFSHLLGAPGVPRAPSTPHPAGGPGFPSAPAAPHAPGIQGYPTPPGVPSPAGAPGLGSPGSAHHGAVNPSPAAAGSFPSPEAVPSPAGASPVPQPAGAGGFSNAPFTPHPHGASGLPSSSATPHPQGAGGPPSAASAPAIPHLLGGVGLGASPGLSRGAAANPPASHAPAHAPVYAGLNPQAAAHAPPPGSGPYHGGTPDVHRADAPPATSTGPSTPAVPTSPPQPPSLPGFPSGPSLPGFSDASRFPSAPVAPSFPGFPAPPPFPSFPGGPAFPAAGGGRSVPEGGGAGGLKGFVEAVRRAHFSGRDDVADKAKGALDQRLSSGRTTPADTSRPLDVASIREDFPILRQQIHGRPLAWFDNAATTQKPQCVIDEIKRFYEEDNSNIHRAAHSLAARSTDAYEKAREKVKTFLGASSVKEIVFARGTTEAINFVTQTYGRKFLQPGDEVVLTTLEHHASIVPWQRIAKETGAVLRVVPVNDRGEIILEDYQKILGSRTKVVSMTHASNSLGTILPVAEMTQMAKRYGARVLIDGAQSVAHIPVDVQKLGCDFFVFSGHKIFGPTGIGACYVKEELHDILPPWQGGGNMIKNVTFEETTYSDAPAKFEAGTPNIADAVGLGAALDYVGRIGLSNIAAHEHLLLEYATHRLGEVPDLRIIGNAREKVSVVSFVLPNRRTEEIGRLLDLEGIAVRSGHHCSQPSLRRFGVESTVRPSFSVYNTTGEIDRLVEAVKKIRALP